MESFVYFCSVNLIKHFNFKSHENFKIVIALWV